MCSSGQTVSDDRVVQNITCLICGLFSLFQQIVDGIFYVGLVIHASVQPFHHMAGSLYRILIELFETFITPFKPFFSIADFR